jgi:DnaJ-class molecular chaperone
MSKRDYYEVLGVSKGVDETELKKYLSQDSYAVPSG